MRVLPLLVGVSLLPGCALHHGALVNYSVPVSQVSEVKLIHCDTAAPPHCQKIAITYAKNSEVMQVKP